MLAERDSAVPGSEGTAVLQPDATTFEVPLPRRCPFEPPAEYEALRSAGDAVPVRVPTGQEAWLVTRYADVRRLLTDPRVTADRAHPNMPLTEAVTEQARRNIAAVGKTLIGLDQPEHGPRRRMLIPEFTAHRMQALRPHIQATVDSCVDDLLARPRPVDLVEVLALAVPARTLCELLGLPYADRELFERNTAAQTRRGVAPEARQSIGAQMWAYLDQLITAKTQQPTDDLLGRLILRNQEAGLYDHRALVGLTMLLVTAGFESTASMIALGVARLLQQPTAVAEIVADPAAVAPAVEELLRYLAIVDILPRVALADIEVGGVTVPAGAGLLLSPAAANRDGTVFTEPATLDIHREDRHHMAFGYGIHQCIGQNLAREQIQIALTTLFTRVPGLRLAVPVAELPFRPDSNVYGLDALPVTW